MVLFDLYFEVIVIATLLCNGLSNATFLLRDFNHPNSQLINIELILMETLPFFPQLQLKLIVLDISMTGLAFLLVGFLHGLDLLIEG